MSTFPREELTSGGGPVTSGEVWVTSGEVWGTSGEPPFKFRIRGPPVKANFWEGDATKHFSVKKRGFQ